MGVCKQGTFIREGASGFIKQYQKKKKKRERRKLFTLSFRQLEKRHFPMNCQQRQVQKNPYFLGFVGLLVL